MVGVTGGSNVVHGTQQSQSSGVDSESAVPRQSPSPLTVPNNNNNGSMQQEPMIHPSAAVAAVPGSTSNQFPVPAAPVTHNLMPHPFTAQSQQLLAAASLLNGTPGHPVLIPPGFCTPPSEAQQPIPTVQQPTIQQPQQQPIRIQQPQPILTVQDRPLVPPIYNGVNPNYPGVTMVHGSPPIFSVENFLTPHECDFLIAAASDSFTPAPVVGKGSGEISPSRTSSTCYLAREDVPDLMRKVTVLTGKPVHTCELPQVGRYEPTQQYLQHFDAFDVSTEDGLRFATNGGQRTVTVLIYLNDVANGGQTRFPLLDLNVQPRKGMALVFFPATIDGLLDKMALHAALPAVDTKFVSQVWIRQGEYKGQPSKRLDTIMGVPFGQEVMN